MSAIPIHIQTKYTIDELKDILRSLGLPVSGTKRELLDRINVIYEMSEQKARRLRKPAARRAGTDRNVKCTSDPYWVEYVENLSTLTGIAPNSLEMSEMLLSELSSTVDFSKTRSNEIKPGCVVIAVDDEGDVFDRRGMQIFTSYKKMLAYHVAADKRTDFVFYDMDSGRRLKPTLKNLRRLYNTDKNQGTREARVVSCSKLNNILTHLMRQGTGRSQYGFYR